MYKRGVMGRASVNTRFASNSPPTSLPKPPNIPDRYNKQSELRREVKPGQNEFNFDLTTEAK